MRYSTEPIKIKFVEGYGFFPFSRKFGDKYSNKLMDTVTITASKRVKNSRKNRKFNWK